MSCVMGYDWMDLKTGCEIPTEYFKERIAQKWADLESTTNKVLAWLIQNNALELPLANDSAIWIREVAFMALGFCGSLIVIGPTKLTPKYAYRNKGTPLF